MCPNVAVTTAWRDISVDVKFEELVYLADDRLAIRLADVGTQS